MGGLGDAVTRRRGDIQSLHLPSPCLPVPASPDLAVPASPSRCPRLRFPASLLPASVLLNVVAMNPRVFLRAVASLEENLLLIFARNQADARAYFLLARLSLFAI
jgi:hypothetical protein